MLKLSISFRLKKELSFLWRLKHTSLMEFWRGSGKLEVGIFVVDSQGGFHTWKH